MSRWWLRAGGSIAAAAVLLLFVPLDVVWAAVRRVDLVVWLASVGIFVAGHALNALKLRVLVGTQMAPASAFMRAHFTGMVANLGLPGVAGGDLVRVGALAPTVGTTRVALAAVVDRVVDGLVLALMVVVASRVAGMPSVLAVPGGATLRRSALAVVVVLAVLIVWRRLRTRPFGTGLGDAWRDLAGRPHALLAAMAVSAGVQSAFVLTNVWLASQVGLTMRVAPWFLAWTAAKLSAVLPISLGGIGVREATLVSVLAAYGAPADAVLATGILWQGAIIAGSLAGFLVLHLARQ